MYTGRSCILICEKELPAFADAEAGSRNYIDLHSIVFVKLPNEIPEAVNHAVCISSEICILRLTNVETTLYGRRWIKVMIILVCSGTSRMGIFKIKIL